MPGPYTVRCLKREGLEFTCKRIYPLFKTSAASVKVPEPTALMGVINTELGK
jgi:hypothetical protein